MIDFLVIGGGIAGVSVAARLAPLGSLVLLEAEGAMGYHASGRSAALFEAQYGLATTVALNRASADFHHTADGGFLSPRGLMLLAGKAETDRFETDRAALDMQEMSVDEATARVPILDPGKLGRAAFHEAAFDIDTDRQIQSFAKTTRSEGGRILTGEKATRITRIAGGWRVETGTTEYETRLLINAAGAWVDEIAKLAGVGRLGFTPCRRSMARLPAPGGLDVASWPMLLGTGETWYAKPDAGKWLVSPAEEHPVEPHDAWADDMVLAEGLARYEALVNTPVTRVETSWAGLRTFSPDRSLVIGFDPAEPSFFWQAGQGGYGFQTAPAASQLAADLIAGRPSELDGSTVAALSPGRFA